LRRFQQGSQDAATFLYLRYVGRVRALLKAQCSPDLARRVEVEELEQSVFRSFFHKASNGYYDVPDGEDLWRLLLVIALNKVRARANYLYAAKRDVRLTTECSRFETVLESAAEDQASYTLLQLAVAEALDRLPAEYGRMLELRIEGYAVAEIADQTGRSHRTVERILQESRKKLGILLESD
jgi:RNA polymerase sigma-70 factor (ECF subfamily)